CSRVRSTSFAESRSSETRTTSDGAPFSTTYCLSMSRDDAFLLDMLLAARLVAEYARDLSNQSFRDSQLHQDAIVRRLEVVGEAARHVSEATRRQHPAIEWNKITG